MEAEAAQNNFIQLVAFFLAEVIRSRRISLRRAAEISDLVVRNLNSINTESEALTWVTEIEKDFEELNNLKQALRFNYQIFDIQVYEREIKEYASLMFKQDMVRSSAFLKDASNRAFTIQQLCIKYPDFCGFLQQNTDKGMLLSELQPAV